MNSRMIGNILRIERTVGRAAAIEALRELFPEKDTRALYELLGDLKSFVS